MPVCFRRSGLTLQTIDGRLVPRERGSIVSERGSLARRQATGRSLPRPVAVWREAADGEWSRAALPINLVNDTENAALQGLLAFLYRGTQVSSARIQLVQQTAPYLVKPHFTAAALATAHATAVAASPDDERQATPEWSKRLPVQPAECVGSAGAGRDVGRPRWAVVTGIGVWPWPSLPMTRFGRRRLKRLSVRIRIRRGCGLACARS
jgi:hypothetical protein